MTKGFLGGRYERDNDINESFKPVVTPEYQSRYPVNMTGKGIVVKLAMSSLYGSFSRGRIPHLSLGFVHRNPAIYRKWYRPTLVEIQLAAYNDPRYAYYLWKYNELIGPPGKIILVLNDKLHKQSNYVKQDK